MGLLENIRRDVLYALRTMRANPVFAATAVLTLGLGIGGNTAMFSVIHAVLLKPLAYRDPGRLVHLSLDNPPMNIQGGPFSLVRFEELKPAARSFAGLGAYGPIENMTLSGGGAEPEALTGARVSANFLDVLGKAPILGRSFLPEEDTPGGPAVAMISEALWKRRFGGDPSLGGKAATLNATSYTIIGVLPAGFEFPYSGVDVWVTKPSEYSELPSRYWRFVTLLTGFARLKPGVTLEQARAEMAVLNQQYIRAHPGDTISASARMRVVWLKDRLVANVRPMLWMLFGAVAFVLLIACANVASLLLARVTSRSREFAVRAALGAGRGRLIGQLLAESVVLALAGGVVGVLVAKWSLSAIVHLSFLSLPRAGEIRLDGMVLAFTVALSVAAGVLFGIFPSLQMSRPDLAPVLRETGAGAGRGSGRRTALGVTTRGLLVISQVALSVVLLIGAALLMKSLARLHGVDPGFQPAHVLTMKIALPPARYDTDQKKAAFFGQLVERVEAAPGVRGATIAMSLPATRWIRTNITQVEGQPPQEDFRQAVFAVIQSVTPGYFRTLGIPLLRGREFAARDNVPDAPPVMVINESLARRLWPRYPRGQDPVGRRIGEGYDKAVGWIEIVGIAADVHDGGLASDAVPEFYLPCTVHPPQTAYLAVRASGDPLRLVNTVRHAVLAADRDQPVSDVRTMDEVLETSVGQRRLTMLLLGVLAGVAWLLAVVGIYGIIACSVAQRTQEMGIRRALGAGQGDILWLVLGQGLGLALGGVALGVGGALALTRVIRSLLFHISATDPAAFLGAAVLFVLVALAASYVPARRAARIDPMAALRVG